MCDCSSFCFLVTHLCLLQDPTFSMNLALGHLDWPGGVCTICPLRWSDHSWYAAGHIVLGTLISTSGYTNKNENVFRSLLSVTTVCVNCLCLQNPIAYPKRLPSLIDFRYYNHITSVILLRSSLTSRRTVLFGL